MIRKLYLACVFLLISINIQTASAADIKECVGNSDYYEVLEPCTKLIENHDNGSDTLSPNELIWVINTRGRAWEAHGEYDKLSIDIERGLLIDPNNLATIYNRYLLRDARDEYELKLTDITKVIEGNYGDAADNFLQRAWVYDYFDHYKEVIIDLDEAINLTKKFPLMFYLRGRAHIKLENHEIGIADLTKFISKVPDDEDAYYDRAYAYRDIDEFEKMLLDAQKNLELNEDESSAYNLMGNAQRRNDMLEVSLKNFAKALELVPSNDNIYYNIGLTRIEMNQFEEAAKAFEKKIELDTELDSEFAIRAYLRLVEVYQDLKQYEKVTQTFERLSKIDPNNEDAKEARLEFEQSQNTWSCKLFSQC